MNAGYVRLSRDDDKRNYVSIENQKLIIEQFALTRGIIIDRWYEDDGVSGYKFDRPGFNKLIDDMDNDIDTIIAKDLSRIGRHNAKVLLLLDDIKEQGKRLMLVDDDYDTFKDNDDIIGIKTWYNERYVKDTSKKIKRVLGARQKEGTLVIGVPFGYTRSLKNKNVIEIVDKEATYIKKIYDLYLQGFGYRKIAGILTVEEVPTPSMVIRERYLNEGKIYKRSVTSKWSDNMVADILKNDFYIGNLRLHKRERITLNGTDHRVAKEEQLVFENNHDGIIDESTYNLVQEIMKKRIKTNYRGQGRAISEGASASVKSHSNIFGGCLFCKDCGSRLTPIMRKNNTNRKYYICNTYNSKGKRYCERSHLIEEQALIHDVITYISLCRNALSEIISTYDMKDFEKEKATVESKRKYLIESVDNNKKQLKTILKQKIKDLSSNPENAEIINETYTSVQDDIIAKIHGYEQQLAELEQTNLNNSNVKEKLETALEVVDNIIAKGYIDRKDVEILVEKIIVDKEGLPEIELKYGLNGFVKYSPADELNRKENEIILTTMKLIYDEERSYTSAKFLSNELTGIGYKKSKKSVLPYIAVMIDKGILKPTGNSLKPYDIIISKEELYNMINVYIDTMSAWWNARNDFRIHPN